jgi:hypothetical protein
MLALGLSIEATGRYLLHLWYYPYINSLTHEILLFLFYPFILISFREMYNSVNKVVKNRLSFILTMLLGILLWEVPNLFSGDWIYSFPGPGLVGINPIFILGWILLIGLPVFIFNEYLDV